MPILGTREQIPAFSFTPQFKKYIATTSSFEQGERDVSIVAVWNGMHKIVVLGHVTDQNTGREGQH